ncbi:hypothetical protein LHYA1_G009133, partial [Lachnellula hyalina]
ILVNSAKKSSLLKLAIKKPLTSRRVILIKDTIPLTACNALNRAFASKGVKDPIVLLVSKSLQANLVKDVTWHKIVAHGIPTSIFNYPEGMELVKDEIRTFNKGLTPLGQLYWITSAENRLKQIAGSVAIVFATPKEASAALAFPYDAKNTIRHVLPPNALGARAIAI